MQKHQNTVIVWFFLTVAAILIIRQATKPAGDPALAAKQFAIAQAKLDLQLQHLERNDAAVFYGCLGFAGVLGLCVLIVATGLHRERVKKASVHVYKVGHSEIVIHERDLSAAWQIVTGLTNAEELNAINGGTEKALQLYAVMADVQSRQMQALLGKRGIQPALPEAIAIPRPTTPPPTGTKIPTFQELLTAGELAPGKPMILGFEQGKPRRGSFLDIYSAAVAGESGSGKTITLLFLIGSGIVACGVRFVVIDPHYPHPKSLGAKITPLVTRGIVTLATKKADMFRALQDVETTLANRLQQTDLDPTPVVLVLDELTLLSKMSVGATVFRVMERISTEGRKCAVYMLASSQTWLASRTGADSVVRDTLTSAYVHRIKPKQAHLLLQDKTEVAKVKTIKAAGEVLLCPVEGDSVICQIPDTTKQDIARIAEMVSAGADLNQAHQAENQPDATELPKIRQIEKATGIPYSPLQRYFAKGAPLKAEYKVKLEAYLFQQQQVESAMESIESADESALNQTKVIQ